MEPFKAPEIFLKPYDPAQSEGAMYQAWEESGYFNPDNLPPFDSAQGKRERTEAFSIIMPPPNANGSLHAGHALFVTLQDIMIRYQRMRGKKTLWVPGADHAGFETQVVYEKKLEKEGRSRFDMQPDELYKEILKFTLDNKSFMEGQIRQLGASCDWSREVFTLDERVIHTVYGTFQKLSDDGLLYRGARIVNWCPKHQTSLSNLETEYVTRTDPFYYFQYGPFVIGTVRPETKFGDKYVVMHPDDERYAQYKHGQQIEVEWINGPIMATIIKDEASDPTIGTGVMTITPWHSAVDFEIAKRHNLDMEQIIDWRGKLLPVAGEEFAKLSINDARAKIVHKLESKGLLVKVDDKYTHEVPVCYKCNREIEPQVKDQWFVSMKPLAQKALEALDRGDVQVLTEQHDKILRHWLTNIQDWNISRQIVWGIPIPAKLCDTCNDGFVDIEDTMTVCPKCGGPIRKDPDTFDTWFSSGQWPFITLGYPERDFKSYYPTTVMETAADILFFWVARMIMLGLYRTGEVPFKYVYLHGLVRDAKGVKMSKSKGNVISPLDVSSEYGTDALRMGLIIGNTPGTDMNLDPRKIGAYKKFANKIWNITRFILESTADIDISPAPAFTDIDDAHWKHFEAIAHDITQDIEGFRFHLAGEKIYHYLWHTFADDVLEESKPIFKDSTDEEKRSRAALLLRILKDSLKLLHPFMPFVTETIWQNLPEKESELLMVAKWPSPDTV